MGLGLESFLDLTPFQWVGIRNRFIQYQDKADQERWEMARWTVFRTACPPQPKIKGGKISVFDLIRFPWEEKEKAINVKPERNEKRFRALAEKFK